MLQKLIHKEDLFQIADAMQFGELHFKTDAKTGLRAVIAIHNTNLGPALGGCRCVAYDSTEAAIYDALRLAQGMSYKAAISGIAHGGGKSVLIKPAHIADRDAYFEAFGAFVDTLGGRYITAVDSGTSVSDMDIIARKTRHVVSTSNNAGGKGDPSPYTSHGVLRGIQAGVKFSKGTDDLSGVHVAIQGGGNVGYNLAKELSQLGARLTMCDNKPETVARFAKEFGAESVDKEKIFDVECDVFAPCARGGVLTHEVIKRLKTGIIAGGANNQLADPSVGEAIQKRGIVYAPDYVINAGGLIQVSLDDEQLIMEKVSGIYDSLLNIFKQSKDYKQPSNVVADRIAREIIDHAGGATQPSGTGPVPINKSAVC
ncbi:MAG TPA: Glu/Leu/Phe/Val dehydrogenase dimerization domain-containing protein [Gammaproteobacteria bacterium]